MVAELLRSMTERECVEPAKLGLAKKPPAIDDKRADFEKRVPGPPPEQWPDVDPPTGEYFLG